MNVQQLEVKLFATADSAVDAERLIPIFHRWIQNDRLGPDAHLIDVADYRHVPKGPGVMLVADGAMWRMDEAGGELGMVYARKRDAPGPVAEKLAQGLERAIAAARALEDEPVLLGALRFRGDRIKVTVMSRLVAGDDDYAALEGALRTLGGALHPDAAITVEKVSGPREALAAELSAATPIRVAELAARLA